MKDISTHDHISRLCIAIERRVRAECITRIQPSGPHAASVKARQREERQALKGLNAHLRNCVREVERQTIRRKSG